MTTQREPAPAPLGTETDSGEGSVPRATQWVKDNICESCDHRTPVCDEGQLEMCTDFALSDKTVLAEMREDGCSPWPVFCDECRQREDCPEHNWQECQKFDRGDAEYHRRVDEGMPI